MEYKTDDQDVPDIIWKDLKVVDLNLPYIPGLLAFREAHPVIDMIRYHSFITKAGFGTFSDPPTHSLCMHELCR